MGKSPLLSIIIPTKNRYSTLLPVLDSIRQIDSNSLEIVIQDNSDDNTNIKDYLVKAKDDRLRYYFSTEVLSQTGNSDLAVMNSKGDYICFIGDDDGVMPYIVDIVVWMQKKDINILKGYTPTYFWPKMKSTSTSDNVSGILAYSNCNNKLTKIDCKLALKDVLNKGGTTLGRLPGLYHGIVKKSVLNKVFDLCNSYFPGPSPDMANAVALSLIEDYCWQLNYPIIISGKSIHSIGGQGIIHQHINKIEEVKHLPADTAINWSSAIPKYWTGETIWAESALKSLERCGFSDRKKELKISYIHAAMFMFHSEFKDEIFKEYKYPIYTVNLAAAYIYWFVFRGKEFIKNRIQGYRLNKISNVINMQEAIDILLKMYPYNKFK